VVSFLHEEIGSSFLLNSRTEIYIIQENRPFAQIALHPQPSCISAIVTPSNFAAQDQGHSADPSEINGSICKAKR